MLPLDSVTLGAHLRCRAWVTLLTLGTDSRVIWVGLGLGLGVWLYRLFLFNEGVQDQRPGEPTIVVVDAAPGLLTSITGGILQGEAYRVARVSGASVFVDVRDLGNPTGGMVVIVPVHAAIAGTSGVGNDVEHTAAVDGRGHTGAGREAPVVSRAAHHIAELGVSGLDHIDAAQDGERYRVSVRDTEGDLVVAGDASSQPGEADCHLGSANLVVRDVAAEYLGNTLRQGDDVAAIVCRGYQDGEITLLCLGRHTNDSQGSRAA